MIWIQVMNGRWFDERQLQAYVADGSERFRKSDDRKAELPDGDGDGAGAGAATAGEGEGENERLDRFGEWLEEEKEKEKKKKKDEKNSNESIPE